MLLAPSYKAPLRSKRACHLRLLCVSVFQSSAKTSEPLPFISILSQPVSEPSAGIAPAPTSKQATQGVDIKTVLPLLPASYRTKDSILQVPDTGAEFLWYELGVVRSAECRSPLAMDGWPERRASVAPDPVRSTSCDWSAPHHQLSAPAPAPAQDINMQL